MENKMTTTTTQKMPSLQQRIR